MTTATFTLKPNPPSLSELLRVLENAGLDPDRLPFTPETIDLAEALLAIEIDWQNTTVLEYEAREAAEWGAEQVEVCGID